MRKLIVLAEITLEEGVFDGTSQEEIDWFNDEVLGDQDGLLLHSNEVGDTVGTVKVLYVAPADGDAI